MQRMPLLSAVLAVTALVAVAREGRLELKPAYYELTPEVETPHVKWGKPLAGGPAKVLIIAPAAGHVSPSVGARAAGASSLPESSS